MEKWYISTNIVIARRLFYIENICCDMILKSLFENLKDIMKK